MKGLRYVLTCLFLFLILILESNVILKANAESTVIYDFIEYASKAQWSSGAGALPFPGDPSDKRGFARYVYNAVLEDGTKWSKVLETHPEWISEGWIMGVYPQQIVQRNTQLIVKVGFLSGATGTDGVRFDVYFDEYSDGTPIRHTILRQWAYLDGKLDTLIKDLSFIAGKRGNFILYVYAGKTSNRDWAVWAEAKIETIPLPDLIITDIWQKDNRIYYKIKNIGNANATYFFNALFIDEKNVAKDYINTIIGPGKEIERYFDYDWHATLPEHIIKVCADYGNKVIEKDEENNCREETWYLKLPDLVITDIWEVDGRIHYKVKNIGDAATTSKSFQNCLSIDGKQVATHVITQVLQPGQEVEGVFDYVWQPTPGEYFVKVCADCKQEVQESNEENNCLEEKWLKEKLPDLIIIEIKCDRNKSLIGYVIKNIGSEVAKGNHSTVLYVDGNMITHDLINVDLKPEETFESWFKDYEWPECRNITVKVRADDYDQVKESNEFNNALEKICISYPIPITIVSGPNVVNITQDSVTIVWTTNKKSDSRVEYSERSSGGWNTIHDHNKVKEHVVKITGLKPRTTYMFVAYSKDDCGNFVTTNRTMIFETKPPPDNEKPWVRLIIPDKLVGNVDILAEAGDNIGVEGVSFIVDGVLRFMALSPPRTRARYVWACDTRRFPNGVHTFSVVAFDAAGNTATDIKNVTINNPIQDLDPPIVRIFKPNVSEVRGLVQIEARISDISPPGGLRKAEIYIDNILVKRWEHASFNLGPFGRRFLPEELDWLARLSAPTNLTLTYLWDATGLEPLSEHMIEVKAWDYSDNLGSDSKRIHIGLRDAKIKPPGPVTPIIVNIGVTRDVERIGESTIYLVTLTVKNTGTVTLRDISLVDYAVGFQAFPASQDISVEYDAFYDTSIISFSSSETLPPGQVIRVQYKAVPILGEPIMPDNYYVFGLHPASIRPAVSFSYDNTNYRQEFELMYHPEDLSSAFRSADYVIITYPLALFNHNPNDEDGVNSLLVKMAELAEIRKGVLAYLRVRTSAERIRELISPSGAWASRLSPVFRDPNPERGRDAYVLIVGETEIVPSYTYQEPATVRLSDHYYADVVGGDGGRPDLIIGRIIGDSARDLIKPIESSIRVSLGDGFDRRLAISAIGYEDGPGDIFERGGENIASDLRDQRIQVEYLRWSNFVLHSWSVNFNDYDALALGDIDGDGDDEIIIANDETHMIYIYEPEDGQLIKSFPCSFTSYDGFAVGNLGGMNIVIAVDEEDRLYVYALNGNPEGSMPMEFNNWDQIALGDIIPDRYGYEELLIATRDRIRIYRYIGLGQFEERGSFLIDPPLTPFDGFAIGNVKGDLKNEIVIIREDDNKTYIYSPILDSSGRVTNANKEVVDKLNRAKNDIVRYTPYDGFAIGDVDGNGLDDIIVICDDDEKIYRYFWNGTDWCRSSIYSRHLGEWFQGVRYSGSPTGHNGFAIGRVIPNNNPKLVISDPSGGVRILLATGDDADKLANERLGYAAGEVSILTTRGHGNEDGDSPILSSYKDKWGYFSKHPFVMSLGCLAGYYGGGQRFGETLFEKGAGVFIASTEISYSNANDRASRRFFEIYDVRNMSAGKALTLYEREIHNDEYWVKEYNFYGDPKFPGGG